MRKHIFLAVLFSVIIISGCVASEESINEANKKIQDRYNSFSTIKYTINEKQYENGNIVQEREYSEMFKRPDKRKQVFGDVLEGAADFYICNGNTAYQRRGNTIYQWDYVNLPPGMASYCGYFVEKSAGAWVIPSELADTSKYDIEISMTDYNGKEAIKAVVREKEGLSELAKAKQRALGREPEEDEDKYTNTYWFDIDNFVILKQEITGKAVRGTSEVAGQTPENAGIKSNEKSSAVEVRTERIYTEFSFDTPIDDSDFEVTPADYQTTVVSNITNPDELENGAYYIFHLKYILPDATGTVTYPDVKGKFINFSRNDTRYVLNNQTGEVSIGRINSLIYNSSEISEGFGLMKYYLEDDGFIYAEKVSMPKYPAVEIKKEIVDAWEKFK